MPPEIEFITQEEAVKMLRCSRRHLQLLTKNGLGPPRTQLGERRFVYPMAELLEWIRQRTTTPNAA